jgi:hypothetical protein
VQLRIGWFDEQYLWETVFVLVFMLYMLIDQAKNGVPEDDPPEGLPVEPPPAGRVRAGRRRRPSVGEPPEPPEPAPVR